MILRRHHPKPPPPAPILDSLEDLIDEAEKAINPTGPEHHHPDDWWRDLVERLLAALLAEIAKVEGSG